MLGTLFRAALLTLLVGPTAIWFNTGRGHLAWWQDPLVAIVVSVLLGVLVILKRLRARGIPMAAVFVVVMFAILFWFSFLVAFRRGLVEL